MVDILRICSIILLYQALVRSVGSVLANGIITFTNTSIIAIIPVAVNVFWMSRSAFSSAILRLLRLTPLFDCLYSSTNGSIISNHTYIIFVFYRWEDRNDDTADISMGQLRGILIATQCLIFFQTILMVITMSLEFIEHIIGEPMRRIPRVPNIDLLIGPIL